MISRILSIKKTISLALIISWKIKGAKYVKEYPSSS